MRKARERQEERNSIATAARQTMPGRPVTAGRRRQRDVLCDVMLSATQCDTWLTLEELAKLTHYPPASISAQLRHLRKQEFGGYEVEKRQRLSGRILQGEDFGTIWEYRLQRGVCKIQPRGPNATDQDPMAAAHKVEAHSAGG